MAGGGPNSARRGPEGSDRQCWLGVQASASWSGTACGTLTLLTRPGRGPGARRARRRAGAGSRGPQALGGDVGLAHRRRRLREYLWRVAAQEAESLYGAIWRLCGDPVSWDSRSQAGSPGWARAPEDQPTPAPGCPSHEHPDTPKTQGRWGTKDRRSIWWGADRGCGTCPMSPAGRAAPEVAEPDGEQARPWAAESPHFLPSGHFI